MIEERLRDVMIAHDAQAPDGSNLVVPVAPRVAGRLPRRIAAIVGTAVVLAGVIATFGVHSQISHRSSGTTIAPNPATALQCPTSTGKGIGVLPWVPAKPQGVDGSSRMVPLQVPSSVVVCAYIPPGSPGGRSGSKVLSGDLQGVVDDLGWVPPVLRGASGACADVLLVTDGDSYLIGLNYGHGLLWVSASFDHCDGSGNGVFTSPTNLGGLARSWYRAGRWTAPSASTACQPTRSGRLGQERSMVPADPISVTACQVDKPKAGASQPATSAVARQLIRNLNDKTIGPSGNGSCRPTGSGMQDYNVLFDYREGPPVLVVVLSGCVPEIWNGSLHATGAGDVLPLLKTLLATP